VECVPVVTFTRSTLPVLLETNTLVLDSILFWKGKRYELYATCVMADHVHFLIEPRPKPKNEEGAPPEFFPLSEIRQSLKSNTAHEINKLPKRPGAVVECVGGCRTSGVLEDITRVSAQEP